MHQVWSSRLSYLLAAVGSAVGLGKIRICADLCTSTDLFSRATVRKYLEIPVSMLPQWWGVLLDPVRDRLLHSRCAAPRA